MVSSNLLATRLCLPLLPTIALTNVLSSTATGKLFQGESIPCSRSHIANTSWWFGSKQGQTIGIFPVTFFLMKTVLFPHLVSADTLYLFLPMFNILSEPIYHWRSYFHMFFMFNCSMCWEFDFPKTIADAKKIIWAFSTALSRYFLWSWHLVNSMSDLPKHQALPNPYYYYWNFKFEKI